MDYPHPMHHQHKPHHHHPQHPLLSNQLQPINSDSHTSMWLDDPYSGSTACPSQRDSGFNSRPASLRSIDSTSTAPPHNILPTNYEQIPSHLSNDIENTHPQYVDMQSVPPMEPDSSQIIPELLVYLVEDDPVIVREAIVLTHTVIKKGGDGRYEVIKSQALIKTLLETFSKDTGDGQISNALANLFHSLSQQQEGLRSILDCGGIPYLLPILEATGNTAHYILTALHNFLIILQGEACREIERYNGILNFVNLLKSPNDKLLTLVCDSLLKMSTYSSKSKMDLQKNQECIQRLLFIFDTTKYDKLLLTISKLLPVISSGNEKIKEIILKSNGVNIFEKHLRTTKSIRIRHNCLITLRNISNQATQKRDIDSLIQYLTQMLSSDDQQSMICSLGILINLTADNPTNKSLFVKLNGVQTLMQKLMMNTDKNDEFIEVTLCTLRHITARHDLENEAREIIRRSYGIGNIIKLLGDKNFKRHPAIIKATVGLIKNLSISQTIIPCLMEQNAVRKLIELLRNIDHERLKGTDDNQQYEVLLNIIVGTLISLSKDPSCRSIIRDMNCISDLIRFSHLPSCSLQQSAIILLRELNVD